MLVGRCHFVGQSLIIYLGIHIQIAVQSVVIMATFIKKWLFTTSNLMIVWPLVNDFGFCAKWMDMAHFSW